MRRVGGNVVTSRAPVLVEPQADVPKPPPAFGKAEPGTPLANLDHAHEECQAKLKAAGAARRAAAVAAGTAMLRAINRGELDPRSIRPGPSRWPKSRPVPAEEPEDRGGLDWLKWHTARNPQSPAEYAAEVAAYKRAQFAELTSGKVQPASTRRGPRTTVAVLRPLRAIRARRESPARRGGDSGDSAPGDLDGDSEPPGDLAGWLLPDAYSFAAHHLRFGSLAPAARLREFLALPEWQRRQAWRSLRSDVDRERGPPAVTSARP